MNKKRLMAFLTALSCFAAPIAAFADIQSSSDYDPNRGNIEGQTAPTQSDLWEAVQEAKDSGNKAKVKSMSREDYSSYVASTQDLIVTVDENDMWEYHDEVFGMQIELGDHYSLFYQNGNLKNDYVKFAERAGDIPLIRFGGASAMSVNPINMTGPAKERKNTPAKSYRRGANTLSGGGAAPFQMGIPEWLDTMKQLNGGDPGSVIICPNVWIMETEDYVQMAKYCYDDPDESEWGALRAADGYEEPIDVFYWELGNELDYVTFRDQDRIDAYVECATKAIDAIRSVKPDAPILANGTTAPWGAFWGIPEYSGGASWTSWHMGIMPRLVDKVDAIAYHPYYDGYSVEFGALYFADKMKRDIDQMVAEQDIRDENGNLKDIKVVATEHNRWSVPGVINNNFWSSMSVAHYYNACFSRPWYVGATLHCFTGDWSAFWYTAGGDFVMTPTAVMHKAYRENVGDRVCKTSWVRVEEDGTIYDPLANITIDTWGNSEEFSVTAMPKGDNELKVFLVNKTAYKNYDITFDFKNHNYTLVDETRVYAPNTATIAIDEDSEAYTKIEKKELNIPNCTTYTTPTQGLTILTFRTNDRLLQLGEDPAVAGGEIADAPEVEELAFTDIADSYAKNEISALAAQGLISGRTSELYVPYENIKRAEFAYLLGKAMGLKEYKASFWLDVPADSWYAGILNSLYIERIFSGTYFRPEEPMTLGELMTLAGQLCKDKDLADVTGDISGYETYLDADAAYAVSKGIFSKLLEQGNLDIDRYVTREDAAAVMYKLSRLVK